MTTITAEVIFFLIQMVIYFYCDNNSGAYIFIAKNNSGGNILLQCW